MFQVWSVEKLEMKLIDMRELYEEVQHSHLSLAMVVGDGQAGDPFYETADQHHLIGVANIFLEVLFHSVRLDYQTPIISQQGEVVGRLHVEIERTGGSLLHVDDDENQAADNQELKCRFTIKAVSGLPPSLSQYVFCQYLFPGCSEAVKVPPSVCPPQRSARSAATAATAAAVQFQFEHSQEFCVPVTEELVEHCSEGALSVEVYGHVVSTAVATTTMSSPPTTATTTQEVALLEEQQLAKATNLADRWTELTRQLRFSVQILELDETGAYSPVEVVEDEGVGAGGVFQLRQGQQRRICATVHPVVNSGKQGVLRKRHTVYLNW
jgi:kinesin family protein 13